MAAGCICFENLAILRDTGEDTGGQRGRETQLVSRFEGSRISSVSHPKNHWMCQESLLPRQSILCGIGCQRQLPRSTAKNLSFHDHAYIAFHK